MLAIYTAAKTQVVKQINLWYTEKPTGRYFDAIKDLVVLWEVKTGNCPAFNGLDPQTKAAYDKDVIQWRVLDSVGGLYMDLDTLSFRDIAFPDVKEMFASLDVEDPSSIPFPYNNAVVGATPGKVTNFILKFVEGKIKQPSICWGDTGPIVVSMAAAAFPDKFELIAHEILNPFGGNEISQIYAEHDIVAHKAIKQIRKSKVMHLYAKADQRFNSINAEWVRVSKSALATIIKENVPEEIWGIRGSWDKEAYLNRRGKHYAGLFRAIAQHPGEHIMEIGTSSGETAEGMIREMGEIVAHGEKSINYYGIDLFETGTNEQWEREFTGGYVPPKCADVKLRLEQCTKASINLAAMDSTDRSEVNKQMKYWPAMDFIFIDGGHSIETVKSDLALAMCFMHDFTAIVIDDYFPEMPFIGTKIAVDGIDRTKFNVYIAPEIDDYTHPFGRLRTQLVVVTRKMPVKGPTGPLGNPSLMERELKNDWSKDILRKIQ